VGYASEELRLDGDLRKGGGRRRKGASFQVKRELVVETPA
jgi:hypothetical protein